MSQQRQVRLRWQPAALANVAASTGSHHIVPGIEPTTRLGDDVVDALGRPAAVLAGVLVSAEHRPPGNRDTALVRHVHESRQLHDGRHCVRHRFG